MQTTAVTLDEFRHLIALPENANQLFELIYGEIMEVTPGRTRYSEIGHILAEAVRGFCRRNQIRCHTSGGDGAYSVDGHVVAPDFAYKTTPMSEDYPDPVPPLWAVEIILPTDKAGEIRQKRRIYQAANIPLWEIYPQTKSVDVVLPGQPVKTFEMGDTLDVGDLIPGFSLAVRELFPDDNF